MKNKLKDENTLKACLKSSHIFTDLASSLKFSARKIYVAYSFGLCFILEDRQFDQFIVLLFS